MSRSKYLTDLNESIIYYYLFKGGPLHPELYSKDQERKEKKEGH